MIILRFWSKHCLPSVGSYMTGWAAKFGGDLCHGPRPPGPTELHREGVRVEGYQRVPWSKVSAPPTLHLVWFGLTMFDSTWLSLPFGQVATTKYVGFVLVTHSPIFFNEVVVPTPPPPFACEDRVVLAPPGCEEQERWIWGTCHGQKVIRP